MIINFPYLVDLSNGDTIYLRSFSSSKIEEFITFAKDTCMIDPSLERIHATGGGAYKYQTLFENEFGRQGVQLMKHDEMESMVNGMAFVLNYAKEPAFTFRGNSEGKKYVTGERL